MKRTPQTPIYTGIRTPRVCLGSDGGPRKYGSTLQQALAEDVSA
jgi:hypothetical protein